MENPNELIWNCGPLPDIHSVGPKTRILAWVIYDYPNSSNEPYRDFHGKLKIIQIVWPWENDCNSLQWVSNDYLPVGLNEKVTHWAWVIQDSKEPNVSWKTNGL